MVKGKVVFMNIRAWYNAANLKFDDNQTNKHVDELLSLVKDNLLAFFQTESLIGIEYFEKSLVELSPAQMTLKSWWNSEGKEFFVNLAKTSFEEDNKLTANLDYTNFLLESNLLSIGKFTDDSVETLVDIYLQLKNYINDLNVLIEEVNMDIELENLYPYGDQLSSYYDSNSLKTAGIFSQESLLRGSCCLCA